MFKDLHRAGKEPRFILRRLHDSVNELEHPTLQDPTNAFTASYDTVESHHPFQTSTSARRPRLSLTTTTESSDDMERAHSVTPSLENRKDSRQSGVPEVDICSSPRPLGVTPARVTRARSSDSSRAGSDNGHISDQPPPRRRGRHPESQDDHITPEKSRSIITIEQLLHRPHKCSKGENCPKWRKQQQEMRMLQEELQPALSHLAEPVRFDTSAPSVIASSDLLGPSQLPQFSIMPETLSGIMIRDPQANVVQFVAWQHLI